MLVPIHTVFCHIVRDNAIWRRQYGRGCASSPRLCKDAQKLRGQQRSVQTRKEAFLGHVQPALDTSKPGSVRFQICSRWCRALHCDGSAEALWICLVSYQKGLEELSSINCAFMCHSHVSSPAISGLVGCHRQCSGHCIEVNAKLKRDIRIILASHVSG